MVGAREAEPGRSFHNDIREVERCPTRKQVSRLEMEFAQLRSLRRPVRKGPGHGFAVPDQAAYDATAAERHWTALFGLLRESFAANARGKH